ncbi:hypothetical protein D3C72_1947990 [compost metagenome]
MTTCDAVRNACSAADNPDCAVVSPAFAAARVFSNWARASAYFCSGVRVDWAPSAMLELSPFKVVTHDFDFSSADLAAADSVSYALASASFALVTALTAWIWSNNPRLASATPARWAASNCASVFVSSSNCCCMSLRSLAMSLAVLFTSASSPVAAVRSAA